MLLHHEAPYVNLGADSLAYYEHLIIGQVQTLPSCKPYYTTLASALWASWQTKSSQLFLLYLVLSAPSLACRRSCASRLPAPGSSRSAPVEQSNNNIITQQVLATRKIASNSR